MFSGQLKLLSVPVVHINEIYVSKCTNIDDNCVYRTRQNRDPKVYLTVMTYCIDWKCEVYHAGK